MGCVIEDEVGYCATCEAGEPCPGEDGPWGFIALMFSLVVGCAIIIFG